MIDIVPATKSGPTKKVFKMGFWDFVCHIFEENVDKSLGREKNQRQVIHSL